MKLPVSNSELDSVMAMNTVSAVTLIATRIALNLALSLVPTTSSQVTASAMSAAGRLINPPSAPPKTSGPALSQAGSCTPNPPRIVPVKYPDQPTETADAAIAYSMISAQPTVQAKNSPIVA